MRSRGSQDSSRTLGWATCINRVAVCWSGNKLLTANEYYKESQLWKEIQKSPIKEEVLNREILKLVQEFKKLVKRALTK